MKQLKNILVPMDFSPSAYSAFRHAVELAKACNAQLYLLHAYRLITADKNNAHNFKNAHEAATMVEFDQLKDEALRLGIDKIQVITHVGFPEDVIFEFENAISIDLIVIGTSGLTRPKKLLGGTILAIAKNTKSPLLAVSENSIYSNWTKSSNLLQQEPNPSRTLKDYLKDELQFSIQPIGAEFQHSYTYAISDSRFNIVDIIAMSFPEFITLYEECQDHRLTPDGSFLKPILIEHQD